jgi:hypothetical protein
MSSSEYLRDHSGCAHVFHQHAHVSTPLISIQKNCFGDVINPEQEILLNNDHKILQVIDAIVL